MSYPTDAELEEARSNRTPPNYRTQPPATLTLGEYQRASSRTIPEGFTPAQTLDIGKDNLWEAGEAANIIKKHVKHGHDLDAVNKSDVKGRTYRQCLHDELGDVMWAVATICTGAGFDMEQVAQANVDKLRKRYPDGFDPERSKNRTDARYKRRHERPSAGGNMHEEQAIAERIEVFGHDTSTSAAWSEQQKYVWGDKDPEVWTRVIRRIQEKEPKMLAEMEQAIKVGAPTHTVAWIAVNYVLRGGCVPRETSES